MSSFFGRDHPPCGEQYRGTTVGKALESCLNEMIGDGTLSGELATKVLLHFDVAANAHISRSAARIHFKADTIKKYNEFKKVYTVILTDFEVSGRGPAHRINVNGLDEVMVIAHPTTNLKKKQKADLDEVEATPLLAQPLPRDEGLGEDVD